MDYRPMPVVHLLQISPQVADLTSVSSDLFLPTVSDVALVKDNLVVLVSRILIEYFPALSSFSKLVPKHIEQTRCAKSRRLPSWLDIPMKNEVKHRDMLDILASLQDYLGDDYPEDRPVLSGGDQLTVEREVGAQRHMMCGNTRRERLELLEPVAEDWHCLVCFLMVISIIIDL